MRFFFSLYAYQISKTSAFQIQTNLFSHSKTKLYTKTTTIAAVEMSTNGKLLFHFHNHTVLSRLNMKLLRNYECGNTRGIKTPIYLIQ